MPLICLVLCLFYDRRGAVMLLPMLLCFGILVIGPASSSRYVLPLLYAAPLMMGVLRRAFGRARVGAGPVLRLVRAARLMGPTRLTGLMQALGLTRLSRPMRTLGLLRSLELGLADLQPKGFPNSTQPPSQRPGAIIAFHGTYLQYSTTASLNTGGVGTYILYSMPNPARVH